MSGPVYPYRNRELDRIVASRPIRPNSVLFHIDPFMNRLWDERAEQKAVAAQRLNRESYREENPDA